MCCSGSWIIAQQGMENHEDPEESPQELAATYKCTAFETSESVLEGARHMVCF